MVNYGDGVGCLGRGRQSRFEAGQASDFIGKIGKMSRNGSECIKVSRAKTSKGPLSVGFRAYARNRIIDIFGRYSGLPPARE